MRGAMMLCLALLAGCSWQPPAPKSPAPRRATGGMMPSPFIAPGVADPVLVPANEAMLADDAEVVGMLIGGVPRAYSLRAMAPPDRHVVNDVAGGVPVTVTYCDLAKCVRVFTGARPGPLAMSQMGRGEDSLLLSLGGRPIRQSDGKPYGGGEALPTLPSELMAWKDWRARHPSTGVYVAAPKSHNPLGGVEANG